jgi:hypothetical protein
MWSTLRCHMRMNCGTIPIEMCYWYKISKLYQLTWSCLIPNPSVDWATRMAGTNRPVNGNIHSPTSYPSILSMRLPDFVFWAQTMLVVRGCQWNLWLKQGMLVVGGEQCLKIPARLWWDPKLVVSVALVKSLSVSTLSQSCALTSALCVTCAIL